MGIGDNQSRSLSQLIEEKMTQYSKDVENQRDRLAYEKWSNIVKMIYYHHGVTETHYNDGRIKYETDLALPGVRWKKSEKSYEELLIQMKKEKGTRNRQYSGAHSYKINKDGRLEDVIIWEKNEEFRGKSKKT